MEVVNILAKEIYKPFLSLASEINERSAYYKHPDELSSTCLNYRVEHNLKLA